MRLRRSITIGLRVMDQTSLKPDKANDASASAEYLPLFPTGMDCPKNNELVFIGWHLISEYFISAFKRQKDSGSV